MPTMTYIATIECDGVTSEPLELTIDLVDTDGFKHGSGHVEVPSMLAGVVMNASEYATVTTQDGESFKILFSKVLFPECVAEFVTDGPVPEGRKVA